MIDWVMRAQGVSFRHAVELLRAKAGRRPRSTGRHRPARPCGACASPVGRDAGDAEALAQVVEYYHSTLLGPPRPWLTSVPGGSTTPRPSRSSRLGHANRTLSYRLPTKERKEGAELRGRLQRLGVFRASGHEHFNGCVVVPVTDSPGTVVEIYGRKLDWDPRTGQPAHLYLPGPHRGVWNEDGLGRRRGDPLRVVDRRPELLVRRLPQRHRLLRHRPASPTSTGPPSLATG